jgi:hypothetical protein
MEIRNWYICKPRNTQIPSNHLNLEEAKRVLPGAGILPHFGFGLLTSTTMRE